MKLAIASGKGGTGKTFVAVNLAAYLQNQGIAASFIDCDVEEPNAHLFLRPKWDDKQAVNLPVPDIDPAKCQAPECSLCVELCRFKALVLMADEIMLFPELCHGCDLCATACPAEAISEGARFVGDIEMGQALPGGKASIPLRTGRLRIGEAMAPPLIRALINSGTSTSHGPAGVEIRDCPPGATCPVISSLAGVDFVILAAEPTPFGLHDLDIAVQMLEILHLPFGVVVNKDGMGDDRLDVYLAERKIPVLGRIPHSREIAELYARGEMVSEKLPEFGAIMQGIWQEIRTNVEQRAKEAAHA